MDQGANLNNAQKAAIIFSGLGGICFTFGVVCQLFGNTQNARTTINLGNTDYNPFKLATIYDRKINQ